EQGCPVLVRSGDNAELLPRHEWMAALEQTAAVGPSRLSGQTLTRPFVAGQPINQLGPHEVDRALHELVDFVALLHERGCSHGNLEADKVVVTAGTARVLDADTCRIESSPAEQAGDVAALGELIEQLSPPESPVRRVWAGLSTRQDPAADTFARQLQSTALEPPLAEHTARWPRVVTMASVLVVAAVLLFLGSRNGSAPAGQGAAFDGEPAPVQVSSTTVQVAQQIWADDSCSTEICPDDGPSWSDGVLIFEGARYSLGKPGDEIFWGRWFCDVEETPAIFTPAGSLYLFTDMQLPAVRTYVGEVKSLSVEEGGECDSILAKLPDGSVTRFPSNN
ncbi:MAG: hypothetical protein ACC652_07980, partial [Acidimicrobiales bacterium]